MPPRELARLANEYSGVIIGLVETGAGPRLSIESNRSGHQVALDPTVLEAIASLDESSLSRLVGVFSEFGSASRAIVDSPVSPD